MAIFCSDNSQYVFHRIQMFRFEKSFGGVDEQFASGSVMMRTELMERAAFLRIYKRVDLHFAADCTAEETLVGFCLDICLLSKISSGGC